MSSNPSIHFISTAFMKSLFRFFTNFGRIYYFWIRDMKSGWPPSPFVKKSIKVVDRISLISLKSNPPNSTRSYWWLIWSIIKISFWSPDHLVDLRVFELFPEVSHDVPQLHSGNYSAIYNSKETSKIRFQSFSGEKVKIFLKLTNITVAKIHLVPSKDVEL